VEAGSGPGGLEDKQHGDSLNGEEFIFRLRPAEGSGDPKGGQAPG
jgi:hypothetical protein